MKNSTPREPLLHITKRDEISKGKEWAIRIVAIVASLLFCAILTSIITGINPIDFYATIIEGAFGTERKLFITLKDISILLMIALALTPAFKMQFWNIGGEGQVLVGCLAAGACMICFEDKFPNGMVILLMIISSMTAGAVWGLIPAIFKALWNTNETLATLMMNYIATQLVAYFIIIWEMPKGSGKIGIINSKSKIGWLMYSADPMMKYLLVIIVAVVVTAFIYVYQKYTKHGYEISVVGESQNTAMYVGINVKKVIIRTMALSGAICGLVGLLLVGNVNHTVTTTIVNGQGFTAVMVSWLAKFNPIAMVATSFLIVFMTRGAGEITTVFGLNEAYGEIITAIILFFIIGCEFFIRYRIAFSKSNRKGDK